MRGRYWSILGLALLCAPGAVWAGAWTMDEGHGQVITTMTYSVSTEGYDSSRNVVSIPRYRKFELEPLLEYGVTDRFTLMFGPMLQHIDIAAPVDATRTGAGYTDVGGRFRFWQNNGWVFSGQTLVRIPGTVDDRNPAAIGYTDAELDVRALFGKSFNIGPLESFIDLEPAQRFRAGDPPERVPLRRHVRRSLQPAMDAAFAVAQRVLGRGRQQLHFPVLRLREAPSQRGL